MRWKVYDHALRNLTWPPACPVTLRLPDCHSPATVQLDIRVVTIVRSWPVAEIRAARRAATDWSRISSSRSYSSWVHAIEVSTGKAATGACSGGAGGSGAATGPGRGLGQGQGGTARQDAPWSAGARSRAGSEGPAGRRSCRGSGQRVGNLFAGRGGGLGGGSGAGREDGSGQRSISAKDGLAGTGAGAEASCHTSR